MVNIKNITRYFKQSLIDAERLCPEDKELLPVLGLEKSQSPTADYIAVDHQAWLSGRIDVTLAKQIIDSKQPKGKPPLQEVELVLFPRVDGFRYQGGWGTNLKRRVLLPLGVFLRLQTDGQLRPTSKAPWIPREWLAPNQSATEPFGELTVVDSFLTQQPFDGIETWSQLVAYCTALLCAATGTPYLPANTEAGYPGTSLFEFEVQPEYELNQQCLLQTEANVVGANNKILKVLDTLLDTKTLPPLYQRFCAQASPKLQPNQNLQHDKATAKAHFGQMTGEFHLSPKQRNALHHFLKQEECEILAVNGPPGTGKTTLLRSVVANLWSQAALEEKEPPLIVATSNNNQAVTNILESFAKVDEEGLDENLKGRWLPEVASYGLYCCASNRANEQNPYMYLGPKGEGCMQKWQTQDYLNSATEHFIEKASLWRTEPVADVAQAKTQLHQALKQTQQAIIAGIDSLAAFQCIEQETVDSYGSVESFLEELSSTKQLCDTSENEKGKAKSRLDELYVLWAGRSIWVRLFFWLPLIRKEEYRKTARLLNQWELYLEDYVDAANDDDETVEIAGAEVKDAVGNQADKGAATGAVTGGTIGGVIGLLIGIGALAITGIAPVMTAGAVGTAIGGLVGALVGLGIPEDYADAAVEAWLTTQIRQHKVKLNAAQEKLSELHKNRDAYEGAKASVTYWIEQHQPPKLFTKVLADQVSEINDRVLRFKLFKLATHYWEARWLLELKEFFANGYSDKKSPTKLLRKLRRFSKLTPCFVSTFYMVPSTFMAYEKLDDTWKDIPLFNEIDLLIVDEAGQACPEVAAASFALAKCALIVGDTDQIEPVWKVPASVDRANLKLFDLLLNEQQYDDFWLQSGLLASSGNTMRVAQRQCQYHQFSELQRGLYLTEHRRCYDSIVSYCNTLVYKGVLEPLRGEPKAPVPWGTMSMISSLEESKSYGGSRGNPGEAIRIVQWLSEERSKILDYARNTNAKWADKDDDKVLKLVVGIVTPFKKQAELIETELKKEGILGLTVGTVHGLQGDERLIVIFSSVYGEKDRSIGKFYDDGPNMLNVAVSRAKDAFVVFGHPDVFGATNAGTPSGVLRSLLVTSPHA